MRRLVARALQCERVPTTHHSRKEIHHGGQNHSHRNFRRPHSGATGHRAAQGRRITEREIGVTARDAEDKGLAGAAGVKETHAKEGAIAGVAAGAGVGALWGLGILAGVLPGIGTAIAGGTLAAILSSAAAGAAAAGVAGTLIGLGIPEEEANYYDREFRAGRIVVTVDAGRRLQEAQSILSRNSGYDMRSAPERARSSAAIAAMTEEEVRADAVLGNENVNAGNRGRDTRPRSR